ncbi:hypothetical protein ACIQPR_09205 [Streptomyces sp. NPDC091280]|uniref:hypothetical protein n=1 Tax=Streptomyces sp. NPDC091280 TaxID=3365984 RepID=UPI003823142A
MDDAGLEEAMASCISGAFWAAGRNCIGTQRILCRAARPAAPLRCGCWWQCPLHLAARPS